MPTHYKTLTRNITTLLIMNDPDQKSDPSPAAPEAASSSKPKLFIRVWDAVFCWKTARRILISLAVLVTLIAVVWLIENIRGKRAWDKFKAEMDAAGETLNPMDLLPDPVPDEQNFAMTPLLAPLLDYKYQKVEPPNSASFPQGIFDGQEPVWKDPEGKKKIDDFYGIGQPKQAIRSNRHKRRLTDLAAWQSYIRGERKFKLSAEEFSPEIVSTNSDSGLTEISYDTNLAAQEILLMLAKYDAEMAELHAAAKRPHAQFTIHPDEGFAALLPHLQALRKFGNVAQLKATVLLAEKRPDEALKEVLLILRFTESFRQEPVLISGLVYNAMISQVGALVWEGIARKQWTANHLAVIEKRIGDVNFIADFRRHVRGERTFAIGTLLSYQHDLGALSPDAAGMIFKLAPSGIFYQNMVYLGRMYDDFLLVPVDVENRLVDVKKMDAAEDRFITGYKKKFHPYRVLAGVMFPAMSKAVRKYAEGQTEVDQMRIACALEQFRAQHGKLPAELNELSPKFLTTLPHDPLNGNDYKYRVEGDEYVIYGVGANTVDDGGTVVWEGKKNNRRDRDEGDWVWNSAIATE